MEKKLEACKANNRELKKEIKKLNNDHDTLYRAYERLEDELEEVYEDLKKANLSLEYFANWYREDEWSSFEEAYRYYKNIVHK